MAVPDPAALPVSSVQKTTSDIMSSVVPVYSTYPKSSAVPPVDAE